jgi:hypothetical protein
MTVYWHHWLFQFSNFEFPNFTIYLNGANLQIQIISDKSKKMWSNSDSEDDLVFNNHVLHHVDD